MLVDVIVGGSVAHLHGQDDPITSLLLVEAIPERAYRRNDPRQNGLQQANLGVFRRCLGPETEAADGTDMPNLKAYRGQINRPDLRIHCLEHMLAQIGLIEGLMQCPLYRTGEIWRPDQHGPANLAQPRVFVQYVAEILKVLDKSERDHPHRR